MIQAWFDSYPKDEQFELRTRLRSDEPGSFNDVFTEVMLHEALLRQGCKVDVHPKTSDSSGTTPDFLVTEPNGYAFFLECKVVTCASRSEMAVAAIKKRIKDALNSIQSSDFHVMMKDSGSPRTQPSSNEIKRALEQQLALLKHEEVVQLAQAQHGFDHLPKWIYDKDGWRLEFTFMPKGSKHRGRIGSRLIGMEHSGFEWVNTWETIRDAITKKASHYKDVGLPLVLALNVMDDLDEIDVMDALFGREQYSFDTRRMMNGSFDPVASRQPNGAWRCAGGLINTRVSAVLFMGEASAWNDNPRAFLYHHPHPRFTYSGSLTRLPQRIVSPRDTISEIAGMSLRQFLGVASFQHQ